MHLPSKTLSLVMAVPVLKNNNRLSRPSAPIVAISTISRKGKAVLGNTYLPRQAIPSMSRLMPPTGIPSSPSHHDALVVLHAEVLHDKVTTFHAIIAHVEVEYAFCVEVLVQQDRVEPHILIDKALKLVG